MARSCSICSRADVNEINADLIKRIPLRDVAAQRSVSVSALHRHSQDHLPAALSFAREAEQVAAGDSLLEQGRSLHARALAILEQSEREGKLETALKAIREVRGILELLAKLDGAIKEREERPATIQVIYSERTLIANSRDYERYDLEGIQGINSGANGAPRLTDGAKPEQ